MSHLYVYSIHHFMFPFRWDILNKGFKITSIKENIPFDDRTNLQDELFDHLSNWKRKQYSLTNTDGTINHEAYNEFTYFHEFATKAIFDFDYPWKKNQQIVKYYEYEIDKNLENQYIITYLVKTNPNNDECNLFHEKNINLHLDGITLHFYNTGVGVLTYNLSNVNPEFFNKESILLINEYGRRLYPQFLGINGIKDTFKTFLAKEIRLIINGQTIANEQFDFYQNISRTSVYEPYQLPEHIRNILPDIFIFKVDELPLLSKKILITKVTDDRMFSHTWCGDDSLCKVLKQSYPYCNWWYAFIFGDKNADDITIKNIEMQIKHIKKHTYDRWADYGTLFGMSRDSFVCIADYNYASFVKTHMETMYYSISVLCLAQRTSILKFTAEVANLSDLAKLQDDKKLINNIKEVYKNYIEFINKLFFREISPQIQGIEIYNQFHEIMNIKDEISNLDNEISELHQYVSLIQDSERNKVADKLNNFAAAFLPLSLIFGILGANFLSEGDMKIVHNPFGNALLWIVIAVFAAYLIFKLLKKILKITT